jgi:hypothetical protein
MPAMTPSEAAVATAGPINRIGAGFMSDPDTYRRGRELGLELMDFYVNGRAGFLAGADAAVVQAILMFFEPSLIRRHWEAAEPGQRATITEEWAQAAARWADRKVVGDVDHDRLADLSGRLMAGASTAGAPLFAGWRRLPVPDSATARIVHHLNGLRELRGALHAGALLATGLRPLEGVGISQPHMFETFGWTGDRPTIDDDTRARWQQAEDGTNRAMAHIFEVLTQSELDEFVELARAMRITTEV